MKSKSIISVIFLLLGSAIAGVAVFAGPLGLDHNEGWSRPRIGVLLIGIAIMFCAVAYYRYFNEVHSVIHKIQTFIENIPLQFITVPLVLGVILIYASFASPGKSNEWDVSTDYFDLLARGFMNGNLYMPIEPTPELLALSNPYDPLARAGVWTPIDLSLYNGKYYMYWGPVPALILSGVYQFFHGRIGDLFLTFVFVSGIFIAQSLFLLVIWNRYFRDLSRLLLYMSILLIGLAGPLMLLRHNYGSARVYEASITGGQFFFMSGMLLSLIAVTKPIISKWSLATTGILWALAIGTRQILAVPIGFLIFLIALWFFRTNPRSFKKITYLIPFVLPLVFGLACLGWYNWARFGSITETGLYYQLAGANLREHSHELFSQAYILQNLYNYLFHAIDLSPKFPFVFMSPGRENPVFSFYSVPHIYSTEPIAGLLYTSPFAIFAGLTFFVASSKSILNKHSLDANDRKHLNLIILGLSGSFLIIFGLLLAFFWVGIRYTEDFTPPLMILSVIGFWQGYQLLRSKSLPGGLYVFIGVTLAIASILLNTLLAISTNLGLIKLLIRRFPFL